jgi:uncharacterized protein
MSNRYELSEILWPDTPFDLRPSLIFACKRGSEAHGTYLSPTDPNSIDDRDVFGLVVPPKKFYFGLKEWDSAASIKTHWDCELFEVRKYVRLLLKQNPNVLAHLYLRPEDRLLETPMSKRLIENRHLFVNKDAAYGSFANYAKSQIYKMKHFSFQGYMGEKRKGLVEKFGFDVKNASHAIRLYRIGIEYLETGVLRPYRGDLDAQELIDIKTGKWSLDDVKACAEVLAVKAKDAYDRSTLPNEYDLEAIDRLLTEIVEEALSTQI